MDNQENEDGRGVDKIIGDYVYLLGGDIHQVQSDTNIFKSNRYATEEELKNIKTNKLWDK